eukprot:TRINITY_DN17637_c0_g1_i1.p1 TRINITY_DN17637_c0_g1~~TRINITY_DN17637_c0_g1_i1.p1  ORF type:complete len:513 (-),score=54.97 TRINITY_DN17637_c0_g1_i1:107-1645(-)
MPCCAVSKWHVVVAGITAGVGCGFAYSFGTYSDALKLHDNLSDSNVSTVGIATLVVGFITFSSGLLVDRFGASTMLLVGGLTNASAWCMFGFFAINLTIPLAMRTAVFFSLSVIATYGAAICTGAVFGTITKSFPGPDRATAIGIGKAWVGIATGLATTMYDGYFPSDPKSPEHLNYLFFVSGMCCVMILVSAPFIRVPEANNTDTEKLLMPHNLRFGYLTVVTLVVIALTVTVNIMGKHASQQVKTIFAVTLTVGALLPWALLLPGNSSTVSHESTRAGDVALLRDAPRSPWESGPLQMMMRADAWMLWFVIFALQGGGTVLTTNFGAILDARPHTDVTGDSASALFSASQSFGRLFGGKLSDLIMSTKTLTRPTALIILTVVMGIAHTMLLIDGTGAFYVAVILAGMCFGSMYPIMIVSIAEMFGSERIASNYMVFDGFPGAVAAVVISKFLFGAFESQQHACFICLACIEFAAAMMAVMLSCRSRAVYNILWVPPPALPETGLASHQSG